MIPTPLTERTNGWTTETPTAPGWYWLRHAVFRDTAGAWHELYPIIVELGQNGNAPMMIFVSGSEWVRSLDDLVVGEWVGPLEAPKPGFVFGRRDPPALNRPQPERGIAGMLAYQLMINCLKSSLP